jgi:hypothetical protein
MAADLGFQAVPPGRTGRKGRKLPQAFVQIEAAYGLRGV